MRFMIDQIQRAQADTETVYPTLSELKEMRQVLACGRGQQNWGRDFQAN